MSRERAVVCLSGGMDSTVCAALAARDYDAYGLHTSYGQRTEARELRATREVAHAVGLKDLLELRTDLFRRIGGSALTDHSIAVPEAVPEAPPEELVILSDGEGPASSPSGQLHRPDEVPVTYVPFRNAHFLAAAVSWAEVLGATAIFIGAVEQDSSGYPDCRPAYYDAFRKLIQTGTKEGLIDIKTPLIALRKYEIVRLGVELGAPLHISWSCYLGETEACGVCESCVLRLRAFAEAGLQDPIPYAQSGAGALNFRIRPALAGPMLKEGLIMTMPKATTLATAAAMAIFSSPFLSPAALAQAPSATVHGKVVNAAGQPFSVGEVKFTKERTTPTADLKFPPNMVFPIDAQGNYKATGITPGEYFVFFVQENKIVDRLDLVVKGADTDLTLDDDETRAEFIKGMTPEQQKALEEYKKKNAAVVSGNAVITNLNATLKTVRADLAAAAPTKADVSADVTKMKETTTAKPDEAVLWITLGDTEAAQADHLAAADKAAGKPSATDTDVTQLYSDAADAYKKSIDLDVASKKPNPANQATAYNQMGNALKNEGKITEAVAAFDTAAKVQPASAGMYYKNEAAVMYNAGKMDEAAAAADKALAADPNIADAYFIKGQALITKVTIDPKTNKITAPPGCVDAYQKFLELAPNDPKVPQVKEVLTSLGEKITTKYKAGK